MDYFQYALVGFVTATIGALPPGAVNLTVVFETIRYQAANAIPIILAAAVGEVLLAYLVLNFTMPVEAYLMANSWIQYATVLVLTSFGCYLFFKKDQITKVSPREKNNGWLKGFFLAVLNPPVFIFWLVAFSVMATMSGLMLTAIGWKPILVFMVGVFAGKIFALWLYVQLSNAIASSSNTIRAHLNKGIGALLIGIGIIHFIKLSLAYST